MLAILPSSSSTSISQAVLRQNTPSQGVPQPTKMMADTFLYFTKFPLELQREIWEFACEEESNLGRQVLRIAPDSDYCNRSTSDAKEAHLSIVCGKTFPVPSLLHACQESRRAALEVYTLWPYADPGTYYDNGRFMYVCKNKDIFSFDNGRDSRLFGDNIFWFLHNETESGGCECEKADCIARLEFFHDTAGIRNWGFDWNFWRHSLQQYHPSWLQSLHADSLNFFTFAGSRRNPISSGPLNTLLETNTKKIVDMKDIGEEILNIVKEELEEAEPENLWMDAPEIRVFLLAEN